MGTIAWINNKTNICENVSVSSVPASECQPVNGYTLIDLEQTQAAGWEWNGTEWVVVNENIGEGGIGDTWDGTRLIEPKPINPPPSTDQPVTEGTQEL